MPLNTIDIENAILDLNSDDISIRDLNFRSHDIIFNEILDFVSEGVKGKRQKARAAISIKKHTKNKVLTNRRPSRDIALVMLIDLAYYSCNNEKNKLDIHGLQEYLHYLGYKKLYVKEMREKIIFEGVVNKKNSSAINSDLKNQGLKLLPSTSALTTNHTNTTNNKSKKHLHSRKKQLTTTELEEAILEGENIDYNNLKFKSQKELFNEILDFVSEGKKEKRKEARDAININESTKNHVFSNLQPSRDIALVILIDLAYYSRKNEKNKLDIHGLQKYLHYLGYKELYVKEIREKIIYEGVVNQMDSYEINVRLLKEGLENGIDLKPLPVDL